MDLIRSLFNSMYSLGSFVYRNSTSAASHSNERPSRGSQRPSIQQVDHDRDNNSLSQSRIRESLREPLLPQSFEVKKIEVTTPFGFRRSIEKITLPCEVKDGNLQFNGTREEARNLLGILSKREARKFILKKSTDEGAKPPWVLEFHEQTRSSWLLGPSSSPEERQQTANYIKSIFEKAYGEKPVILRGASSSIDDYLTPDTIAQNGSQAVGEALRFAQVRKNAFTPAPITDTATFERERDVEVPPEVEVGEFLAARGIKRDSSWNGHFGMLHHVAIGGVDCLYHEEKEPRDLALEKEPRDLALEDITSLGRIVYEVKDPPEGLFFLLQVQVPGESSKRYYIPSARLQHFAQQFSSRAGVTIALEARLMAGGITKTSMQLTCTPNNDVQEGSQLPKNDDAQIRNFIAKRNKTNPNHFFSLASGLFTLLTESQRDGKDYQMEDAFYDRATCKVTVPPSIEPTQEPSPHNEKGELNLQNITRILVRIFSPGDIDSVEKYLTGKSDVMPSFKDELKEAMPLFMRLSREKDATTTQERMGELTSILKKGAEQELKRRARADNLRDRLGRVTST